MLQLFIVFMLGFQAEYSFEEYLVKECDDFVQVQMLDYTSFLDIPEIEDVIIKQWRSGQHQFACKYYIVSWGCGTGCQMNVIFDQVTGSPLASFNSTNGFEFKEESRLIKVYADILYDTPLTYYEFTNSSLNVLD